MKIQKQIDIKSFIPSEGFIHRYQKLIKEVVIPYQYQVLCDEADGAEKSHVVQNFINAGKVLRGEDAGDGFYGMVFQDSDAAKWLEAVGFSLVLFPDKDLEATADKLIDIIAGAQDQDGYLNTYFTIKDQDKRWTNLLEGHELYCSGHMMEAAVAYYDATGKDILLKVMEKNAEHIYDHFITKGNEGYPGHPEVELALLKMYRATGNKHCLELAKHFIDVRGVDVHFYEKEKENRDWTVWGNNPVNYEYQQSDKPVRELENATGHSVRAVYLYTAMADLAAETDDRELLAACDRLWESITERRMYVTGSIGSTVEGEAFTVDYDLPNDTAYAETCASIGLMFFASRMLENKPEGVYGDIMERAFYNTVLAGMQLDGKRFFYVNPLEVLPGISAVASTHRHDLPQRPGWYACACCPPNVARTISSIGKYAYGVSETTGFCHLYAAGKVEFGNGLVVDCKTGYPYEFAISFDVLEGGKNLAVRIPEWSEEYSLKRNGEEVATEVINGYAYFSDVKTGEKIEVVLCDKPFYMYASSKVAETTGCVALQRGPLVYCFEGVDNEGDVLGISLDTVGKIEVNAFDSELLGGTVVMNIPAFKTAESRSLYSKKKPEKVSCTATAVPYYTWGNRGLNQMRVWMTEE
ncbi:MAG: glycoside hydrolase family 127 protein [Lachnospiraceae bacterium]|nr:glycoside hydrolase family 127 protein [Lachnospiraceae bacterium]